MFLKTPYVIQMRLEDLSLKINDKGWRRGKREKERELTL
jgi:hypothetical protein